MPIGKNKFQRQMAKLAKKPPKQCPCCGDLFQSQQHIFFGELASGAMAMVCVGCEKRLKRIHAGGVYCKQGEVPSEEAKATHPILGYDETQRAVDRFVELAEQGHGEEIKP